MSKLIERLPQNLSRWCDNDRLAVIKALETLTRERDDARAEVERLKLCEAADRIAIANLAGARDEAYAEVNRLGEREAELHGQLQRMIDRWEAQRTQLTATQARLEEAVNILRASVWTEPTFHYQRHWFQRGRDFCAEYDAQQEGQSNG